MSRPNTDAITLYESCGLDRRAARALDDHADAIQAIARRSIIDMGQHLVAAREIAAHGTWKLFLERIGLSERTAQNYMNTARAFGDKPEIISAVAPTVAYMLAAPTADQAVVAQIVREVEAGSRPNVREIEHRLKPPHRPPQPTPIPPPPARTAALLAAKYALLRAAADIVRAELALSDARIMVNIDDAHDAARVLVDSDAVNGVAAMLVQGAGD